MKKLRRQFELDGCHITVDDVCGAGIYLEVEKVGEDRAALEQEVIACAGRLGAVQFEKRSYLALVLEKKSDCSGKTSIDEL